MDGIAGGSRRVSAPASARDPSPIRSSNGYGSPTIAEQHSLAVELFERLLAAIPLGTRDAVMARLHLVNDVLWRSRPTNRPIARGAGSWSFAVVGDYGGGTPSMGRVAANIARSGASLLLTTGDNIYETGTEDEWRRRWDPVYGPLARSLPIFPSVGNHDGTHGLDAYFRRFPHLGEARYYSHVRGDVHFVALDTNLSLEPGSAQLRWLERELASSRSRFRVVYFHHPLLTQLAANRNDLLRVLGPIFRRHGVQLVLTGHEHWYERSTDQAGFTHVLVGNGGDTVAPFPFRQAGWSAVRSARYGHLELEVQRNRLVGRMVDREGRVVDTFVVPAGAARAAAAGAAALSVSTR